MAERSNETDALDAVLVALWQCETEDGFEYMSARVIAIAANAFDEGVRQMSRALQGGSEPVNPYTGDAR